MISSNKNCWLYLLLVLSVVSCATNTTAPSKEDVKLLGLKTGDVISCGRTDSKFGTVDFDMSCSKEVKSDFNIAMELLHSFEYDEAEKVFSKIISQSADCAMAYWGVAMCSFHPLWEPPTEADLEKGVRAVKIANAISTKTKREEDYIAAIAAYYTNWKTTLPRQRAANFEQAMERLHRGYPTDTEAAIFYALSLDAAADPADKNYTNQRKAGELLGTLYKAEPNHPGIIHYIIHTYDYPGIASLGLSAARKYSAVAPSSAHALHMPSHIFTRLGLWKECVEANLKSVSAAKCYAEAAGLSGHWDEELHGLDYLVYAYLQQGDNESANAQQTYLNSIREVYPVNFKEAYTFAAVPARIALENRNWVSAASLVLSPGNFPWKKFPWQEAIIHFGRLLGAVHTGAVPLANAELGKLRLLYDTLQGRKDPFKAKQVAIQIQTGTAWIAFMNKHIDTALALMKLAAQMEDSTSKPPVTPGEVLPARELYADMLFDLKKYEDALSTYETVLLKSPNRFNSVYGAGLAAEKSGSLVKARNYYLQLMSIAIAGSTRPEVSKARTYLQRHK